MNGEENKDLSRRAFLRLTGAATVTLGGLTFYGIPGRALYAGVIRIPPSQGYLLVDPKKCAGCLSCMLACSLAHEGEENLSLSRIQILQNSFGTFPTDVAMSHCRQCVDPPCVESCPTGALDADRKNGNVRTVDEKKCTGCRKCLESCAFSPGRTVWNFEKGRAQKCDLCADARFWRSPGGPDGRQACVEVCPMRAIRFTRQVPIQDGDLGYNVNLRNENWHKLGFPID